MSGAICTPINTFLAGNAEEAIPARLLQDGHQIWGVLRSVEPVGDSLVKAVFGSRPILLPEELFDPLQCMVGQPTVAIRLDRDFRSVRLQI
jgi:hypothetical protein